MDSERIDKLLAKYWECETSLEEENELKAYFNKDGFEEKYKNVAPLFRYYEQERTTGKLDGLFDEQLLAAIEDKKPMGSGGKIINMFFNVAKVAAVILILITAGYFIKEEMDKEEMKPYMTDTFEDPEKAFEETKKALKLLSKNFNKGRKEAQKLSTFNEAQEKVKAENQL